MNREPKKFQGLKSYVLCKNISAVSFVDLKNLFRLLVSAIKIKDLVIVNAVSRASGDTESD